MVLLPPFHLEALPSASTCLPRGEYPSGFDQHYHTQPQTPPASSSGSPVIKFDGISLQPVTPPPSYSSEAPQEGSQVRLPSLEEFDQGVEALARTHGPCASWVPPSPVSNTGRRPSFQPFEHVTPASTGPSWSSRDHPFDEAAREPFVINRRGTVPNLSQYALAADQANRAFQDNYYNYQLTSPSLGYYAGIDGYPSPPPDGENRHINQKYTTEEGDYIIYAWHDKKMKWQRIKQEFAAMFGRTPERTVQGLQAWYYRMNQRIPVWDHDGWLCFANEDDMEPLQVSIKCRERDSQDRPLEPMGLAQRYPERAINYPWVDNELKLQAHDWATKRAHQYRDRRERRKRKELRRMKL